MLEDLEGRDWIGCINAGISSSRSLIMMQMNQLFSEFYFVLSEETE